MREIRLRSGTTAEKRTRDRLRSLLATHDLGPWIFTQEMQIDQDGYPHSHPILTLDAADDGPERLLAAFLHEQLHWFEAEHEEQRDAAILATRQRWPTVPIARPDGAGDAESTRLHLLVCHWEHRALATLLGRRAAVDVIRGIAAHHYRWVYQTVLTDHDYLAELTARFDLIPRGLSEQWVTPASTAE